MIHLPKVKLAFAFVSVLASAGFTLNLAPGWTQSNAQRFAQLISSPQTGTPDNKRTPGGTRTEFTGTKLPEACQQTAKAFTALVPIKGSESLTTAEHPVFWFYIPDAPEDIDSIEFSLHDQNDTTTF